MKMSAFVIYGQIRQVEMTVVCKGLLGLSNTSQLDALLYGYSSEGKGRRL